MPGVSRDDERSWRTIVDWVEILLGVLESLVISSSLSLLEPEVWPLDSLRIGSECWRWAGTGGGDSGDEGTLLEGYMS